MMTNCCVHCSVQGGDVSCMCLAKSWLTREGGARCKMVALNLMPSLNFISQQIPPFQVILNFPLIWGMGGSPLAVLQSTVKSIVLPKSTSCMLFCSLLFVNCVTCQQKELFHLSVKGLSLPIKDPLELFQYLLPFPKYTAPKFDAC